MQLFRLPHTTLATLAERCGALGEGGVAALRESGRVAGIKLFETLGPRAEGLAVDDFWDAFDRKIRDLNLGFVHFEPIDEGVAALAWYRLPETGVDAGVHRSTEGCHLATGLLGGVLSRAANRPIAVLEVGCGSRGSEACWFLIGSEPRLTEIHQRLSSGEALRTILES